MAIQSMQAIQRFWLDLRLSGAEAERVLAQGRSSLDRFLFALLLFKYVSVYVLIAVSGFRVLSLEGYFKEVNDFITKKDVVAVKSIKNLKYLLKITIIVLHVSNLCI